MLNVLKHLLMSLLVIFCVRVLFHDNGLPSSISEAEEQHVRDVVDEYVLHVDDVVQAMEEFTLHPEDESRTSREFITACEKLQPHLDEMFSNPVFYVDFEGCVPLAKEIYEHGKRFESAGNRMADELGRRVEADEWDREAYEEMEIAVNNCLDEQEVMFCIPSECGWCRCHNGAFATLSLSCMASFVFAGAIRTSQ